MTVCIIYSKTVTTDFILGMSGSLTLFDSFVQSCRKIIELVQGVHEIIGLREPGISQNPETIVLSKGLHGFIFSFI